MHYDCRRVRVSCFPLLGEMWLRRIKAWRAAPTCIFWTLWKERNRRFFDNAELLDQRLKSLFLNNFCMWLRVYIDGGYTNLIDFIEWLGIGIGSGYFFVPSFLLFACFTCILLVYSCAFFNTISYLSKKKNVCVCIHKCWIKEVAGQVMQKYMIIQRIK